MGGIYTREYTTKEIIILTSLVSYLLRTIEAWPNVLKGLKCNIWRSYRD